MYQKYSKNDLKYKGRDDSLRGFFSLFKPSDEFVVILTLLACAFTLAFGLASSLKLAVPVLILASIFISVRLKSSFLGFFIIAVFTFQFFSPNKYYELEILRTFEIKNLINFSEGRTIGYGINLSNIFILASLGFMISEIFAKKQIRKLFYSELSKIKLSIIFMILFLISGIFTAKLYSPFPIVSQIWTIQYSQLFSVAILIFYYYKIHKARFAHVFNVLSLTILIQFVISALQFANQSAIGLPIETVVNKQFFYGVDELRSIYRVAGSFFYSNELALIVNCLLALLIPVIIKSRNLLYTSAFLSGLAVLLLTQSRTNWISFAITILYSIKFYKKNISNNSKKTIKKIGLFAVLVMFLFSFVMIPRILLSFNFSQEGGGVTLRAKMIKEGFQALFYNPIFGYGAGMNERVLYSYFPEGIITIFPLPILEAHLQLLLEFGFLGTLFFVAPFYLVLRNVFTISSKNYDGIKDYLFSFIAGFTIFTFHYLLQNHYGVMEFTYIGLILGFGLIASTNKS